jgi:hypothetical protein
LPAKTRIYTFSEGEKVGTRSVPALLALSEIKEIEVI